MNTGYEMLTDREKDTLRLLLRGHDAKSSARALGLSVHTVNERLRDARRKLGVTSSREAARIVLAAEARAPQSLGDKPLGDASGETASQYQQLSSDRRSGGSNAARRSAWLFGGLLAMSIIASLLFAALGSGSVSVGEADAAARTAQAAADQTQSEQAQETAARAWLTLVDKQDWKASFAAAGKAFRAPNTVEGWQAASELARVPLGNVLSRKAIAFEHVNAPPRGYQLVQFQSDFDQRKGVIESVTLEHEDGTWRVVGYFIR